MQEYIEQNKKIYTYLINFLEQADDYDNDEQFQELLTILTTYQEQSDKYREFLQMISVISNYHQRLPNFISRVEEILLSLKEEIKQFFTNSELISLFQFNKLLLLFLIKNEIIVVDDYFLNFISKTNENADMKYEHFFYEEIKTLIDEEKMREY